MRTRTENLPTRSRAMRDWADQLCVDATHIEVILEGDTVTHGTDDTPLLEAANLGVAHMRFVANGLRNLAAIADHEDFGHVLFDRRQPHA